MSEQNGNCEKGRGGGGAWAWGRQPAGIEGLGLNLLVMNVIFLDFANFSNNNSQKALIEHLLGAVLGALVYQII